MEKPFKEFSIVECFLFKGNVLCVPKCSLRISIVNEAYRGTLGGHFGRDKTLALVRSNFFWPRMEKDIVRFVKQCNVCHWQRLGVKILVSILQYQKHLGRTLVFTL